MYLVILEISFTRPTVKTTADAIRGTYENRFFVLIRYRNSDGSLQQVHQQGKGMRPSAHVLAGESRFFKICPEFRIFSQMLNFFFRKTFIVGLLEIRIDENLDLD